jgi:hypothetical protein
MAIARPTTKTIISTVDWGIPITDAVNTNVTDVAALKTTTAIGSWITLPLVNGYTHQAGMHSGVYRKVGTDTVQVFGVLSGPANPSYQESIAWTFPAGYRPTVACYASLGSWTGTAWQWGRTAIGADGRVSLEFQGGNYLSVNFQFYTS